MTRKRHLQTKVCKVSFEIKATALYVNRVIYSVVIFMLQCGYEFNKSKFGGVNDKHVRMV